MAEQTILHCAKRLEWVKSTPILHDDERELLLRHHRDCYEEAVANLGDAEKWLEAHQGPQPTTEWLDTKTEALADLLLGEKLPLDLFEAGRIMVRAGQVITKPKLRNVAWAYHYNLLEIEPSPVRNKVLSVLSR